MKYVEVPDDKVCLEILGLKAIENKNGIYNEICSNEYLIDQKDAMD